MAASPMLAGSMARVALADALAVALPWAAVAGFVGWGDAAALGLGLFAVVVIALAVAWRGAVDAMRILAGRGSTLRAAADGAFSAVIAMLPIVALFGVGPAAGPAAGSAGGPWAHALPAMAAALLPWAGGAMLLGALHGALLHQLNRRLLTARRLS